MGAGPLERTRGLLRRDRLTGGALAFALLVLAGLPPGVIGLVAKVVALRPAVSAGLWPLALVAVVAVVLGIAVYLRWFALLLGEPHVAAAVAPDPALVGASAIASDAATKPAPDVARDPEPGASAGAAAEPVAVARAHRGATAVLVIGTGILVLFSVLPGLLLGLLS